MKLTNEEIRALTVGAVETEEENGVLSFYKCTKKQREAWRAASSALGDRAQTSTGIRLDFHTDADAIGFVAEGEGKYELHVDGLLRKQFLIGKELPCGEEARFDLCDTLGKKRDSYRVTLYLPCHSEGRLSSVILTGASFATRHKFDCKLLMIGDSITQGWDSHHDSHSYAYHVARFFNAESVTNGVGGGYFEETTFDVPDFDPDMVTIAYGTNDYVKRKTYEELREHVSAYLDLVANAYAGKKIFVISPIWRADHEKERAMGSFEGCRAVVIEEAEKRGMIHIDGLSLVPPSTEFFADGYLHPNDMGFALYGVNLVREMQRNG